MLNFTRKILLIFYGNEAIFYFNGHDNRQNCRYWSHTNPYLMEVTHVQNYNSIQLYINSKFILRTGICGDQIIWNVTGEISSIWCKLFKCIFCIFHYNERPICSFNNMNARASSFKESFPTNGLNDEVTSSGHRDRQTSHYSSFFSGIWSLLSTRIAQGHSRN